MSQENQNVLVLGRGNTSPLHEWLLDPSIKPGHIVECLLKPEDDYCPNGHVNILPTLNSLSVDAIKESNIIFIAALGKERKEIIDALIALEDKNKGLLKDKQFRILLAQKEPADDEDVLALERRLVTSCEDVRPDSLWFCDHRILKGLFKDSTSVVVKKPLIEWGAPSEEHQPASDLNSQHQGALSQQLGYPRRKLNCTPTPATLRKLGIFAGATCGVLGVGGAIAGVTAGIMTGAFTLSTVGIAAAAVAAAMILFLLVYLYRRSRQARQYRVVQYRFLQEQDF